MIDTMFSLLGSNQIMHQPGGRCKVDGCFPFFFFLCKGCVGTKVIGRC